MCCELHRWREIGISLVTRPDSVIHDMACYRQLSCTIVGARTFERRAIGFEDAAKTALIMGGAVLTVVLVTKPDLLLQVLHMYVLDPAVECKRRLVEIFF